MRVNEPGSTLCYNCSLPLAGVAVGSPSAVQERGGFWIRVGASLLDWLVMSVPTIVLTLIAIQIWGDDDVGSALDALVQMAYYTLGVSIYGKTLGKHWVGLKVVRPDGSRVGFWRALARFFAQILSALILVIGFLMVAFRKDRRALHDLICDTVVIRVRN